MAGILTKDDVHEDDRHYDEESEVKKQTGSVRGHCIALEGHDVSNATTSTQTLQSSRQTCGS